MNRRQFATLSTSAAVGALARAQTSCGPDSTIGNLCEFVLKQAENSPLELSYLRDEFRDLKQWQQTARAKILDRLFYSPAPVAPDAKILRRIDHGDHFEEQLNFQTTPDIRVPATLLLPKNREGRAPAIVALHDHGGFYLWGREKIIDQEGEHPVLTAYRKDYYGGRSFARDLARDGYVVIAIDMYYWGDRRLVLPDDSPALRERALTLTARDIQLWHRRAAEHVEVVSRSLLTAGVSWPGVMIWDDIRTIDYLVTRPEVDPARIACAGLSVGGYRSYILAALDSRIRAAIGVGWMASFAAQIPKQVASTIGPVFHIPGLYRYLDLPDFSALIAPRPLMLINGSQDRLFQQEGLRAAYAKIERIYRKANVADRQRCLIYDAPHQFNAEMQTEAWRWLKKWI